MNIISILMLLPVNLLHLSREGGLFFNGIYIDHFRMPAHYGSERFSKNLMSNLATIVKIDALRPPNEK